jgi:hypothetical protein
MARGVPSGEERGPLAGGATTLPQAARATAAATVTATAWMAMRDGRIGGGTGG